ncbi:hypothetical protein K4K57_002878 [Colletotrichum sp. SAR 10_99]|nr:hypothetical protein K4K55_003049 [Colletotrichum sp. SAR 10_96]KAJ5013336.1 hypothetical protein K4K57_002878 [Colletotrichum sp. SAR 10_99]
MASLAGPVQGQARADEKRGKRDTQKSRRALFSVSQHRKSPGYPTSWASRWKHRQQIPAIPRIGGGSPRCGTPTNTPLALVRQQHGLITPDDESEPEVILPRTIQIGPEVYTLSRFYANYATTASIVFFNQLPDHYKSDLSEASHTRHATHAVALASAARQLHQPGLMLEARQHYGKAIGILNQALRDPVGARNDGNLVTMFLFGMFELMEMFIQREHLTGIWSVLEEVDTPWGKGPILEPLVRQVVDFKKAFDFKMQVQGDVSKLTAEPAEDLTELVKSGISLCNDLEAAVTLLGFSGVSSFSGQPQRVFNGLFTMSSEVSLALARSHYRCLKIVMLERILDLKGILKEAPIKIDAEVGKMPSWSDGVAVVEEVLDDIRAVFGLDGKEAPADGLPYRTMTMFWPMVLVRTSCFAGPHNGRWVAERMLELTSEAGFGLGVEAANL